MFTTLMMSVMMNMIMEMGFSSQESALFTSSYLPLLVVLHKDMRRGCTDGNRTSCVLLGVYRTDA